MNTFSKVSTLLSAGVAAAVVTATASADHIWINEFHYDNAGADVGEFVEVALRTPNASGFTASDYVIELYNGSGGAMYGSAVNLTADTTPTSFPVAGSASMITLYDLAISGIQNGSPDGIALVNATNGTVEQFLSYEGTFTATSGTASGLTSTDVGVAEAGDTPIGSALAASGSGDDADDFDASSFIFTTSGTPGGINDGQTFVAEDAIPEPASLALLGLGSLLIAGRRRSA